MTGKSMQGFLDYSRHSFGPGHSRLNLNFGLQIRKQSPLASIVTIADSAVVPFFKFPSIVFHHNSQSFCTKHKHCLEAKAFLFLSAICHLHEAYF